MQQERHGHHRRRLGAGSVLIAGIAAGALCLPAAPALAQAGPVSPAPIAGTPTLVPNGTTEEIRQLAACGGAQDAGGGFTPISGLDRPAGPTFTPANNLHFRTTPPLPRTAWDPNL